MAQYSILTKTEVDDILSSYSLNKVISFEVLSGGSENTNYLIKTKSGKSNEKGKYVLTICEQKTEKSTRELAQILEHLEINHFETSKVVHNKNKDSLTLWKDKPIMVKKFIEGKVLKDLSPYLVKLVGRELGKLHKIEAPEYLPKQMRYGKEKFVNVEKYAANSEFDLWLKERLNYVSPYFSSNLPKALIHGDVFDNNVIISDDERSVLIMDFEEASYYYRVFDIGMAIIGTCAQEKTINFHKVGRLLNGYLQETALLDIELNALQTFTVYAGASMTFWRHINFNYTKPDPKMSNHYLGLKVLTDYVEEQPADCFLNLIK